MLPICIAYAYELAIGLGSVCNKNGFRPVGYDTALGVVECLKKEEILLFPGALQNMTAVCEEKHLVIQTHCIFICLSMVIGLGLHLMQVSEENEDCLCASLLSIFLIYCTIF